MSAPNYVTVEPGNRSYYGNTDNDIAIFNLGGRDVYMWEDTDDYIAITDGQSWWSFYNFEDGIFDNMGEEYAIDHNGPILYRMYKATFDRVPDVAGLGYWADQIDEHGSTLYGVASRFIDSTEFKNKFGHNVSNEQFIDAMYQNVLGREADEGGYSYWTSMIDGGRTRESILIGFADSMENRVQVLEHIQSNEPWLIF